MRAWIRWLVITLAAAALAAVAIWVVPYTERPAFCPTCHEMRPYYEAWAIGGHSDVSCMDCHVASGTVNHLLHKFVALKEVWVHFTSQPTFPRYNAEVPDARCTACHEAITPAEKPGLDHAEHAKVAVCQECHPDAAHTVTVGTLKQAGVLNAASVTATQTIAARFETVDATPRAPKGHKPVRCSYCHDMQNAGCDYCHAAPADHYDDACSDCHTTGSSFADGVAFSHTGTLDCSECHDAPARHFEGVVCRDCHSPATPFDQTVFRHPAVSEEHTYRSFPCEYCHPKGFGSAECTKCHRDGQPDD